MPFIMIRSCPKSQGGSGGGPEPPQGTNPAAYAAIGIMKHNTARESFTRTLFPYVIRFCDNTMRYLYNLLRRPSANETASLIFRLPDTISSTVSWNMVSVSAGNGSSHPLLINAES